MASQMKFSKFVTVVSNFRSLFTNRTAISNNPQIATLRLDPREKLKSLPEKPKKPQTPFFLFLQDRRNDLKKIHPNSRVTEIAKMLSEEWKKSDASIKQKYEEIYKMSMTTYLQKYLEYNSKLTEEEKHTIKEIKDEKSKKKKARILKKTLKSLNKPKRPKGPFLYFVLEYYEKKKLVGMKFQEFLRQSKELWENLPQEEKQKFNDMYLDAKKCYELEMEQWEARMITSGHSDLVRQNTLALYTKPIRQIKSQDYENSSTSEISSNLSKSNRTSTKRSTKRTSAKNSIKKKHPTSESKDSE